MDYIDVNPLNKMNTPRIYILIFLILSSIVACHDNEVIITETETIDPPKIMVSATHAIKVTNEFGKKITTYTASFNQQQQIAQSGNLIVFDSKNINKHGEKLTILDSKGFEHPFLISGHENDINYSVVTVFENKNITNITTDVPASIVKTNEYDITTVANSFSKNRSPFSGNLVTTTFVPDLENDYHNKAIPQIRIGKNQKGQRVFIDVSEVFFLKINTTIQENIECDVTISGNTDALINGKEKIWFCDMDAATWKEVITDAKNGNIKFKYQNSGFYCIGEDKPGIYVSGQSLMQEQAIANIELKIGSGTDVQYIYTSAQGHWMTYLEAESRISAEIIAACGKIHTSTIETSDKDITGYNIDLTDQKHKFSKIRGQVKDCEGKILNEYMIQNSTNNMVYFLGKNGLIDVWIATCDEPTITLSTSDISGKEEGNRVVWTVNDELDTGSWFACARAKSPYFNLIIAGENKMYWQSRTIKNGDHKMVIQLLENTEIPMTLILPSDGIGEKMDNQLNILLREKSFAGKGYEIYCPTSTIGCGFERFAITHFDHQGDQFIRGYFKGNFWVKTLSPLAAGYKYIEGEFQVKKEF